MSDRADVTTKEALARLEAWPRQVGSHRCGCEFVDLGDGARRCLQRYLERLEAVSWTGGDACAL